MKKKKLNKEKIIRVVTLCACMIFIVGALCSSLVFDASALSSFCNHSGTGRYYSYENIGDPSTHVRYTRCSTCGKSVDSGSYSHTFEDGVCADCAFPCPHENHTIDGACSDCDLTSGAHNFYNVVSEPNGSDQYHTTKKYCDCGYVENDFEVKHTYIDGVCSACGYQCTHLLYSDVGVCVYCGYICPHSSLAERGVYTTNPDKHPWETYCIDCGVVTKTIYVEHIFNSEHKCSCCEYICTHSNWIDGSCAYCGFACGHDKGFDSSFTCYTCGYVCPHSSKSYIVRYSSNVISHHLDYVCDLCEYTLLTTDQAHVFDSEYKCSACGYNCTHSEFDGIVCDYCGFNCPHDSYSSGVCDLCSFACPHWWEKSTCKICALVCENHTFTNGSLRCDTCDYYVIYDGYQQNDGFFKLMTAIFDAQTNTYFSLLGYEILGVNIAYFVLSLVTLALAIIVFKIVKKVM